MHVHPISTFRLFQEGHLLRNSIAIFALTTLFYFIGAELRLVHLYNQPVIDYRHDITLLFFA